MKAPDVIYVEFSEDVNLAFEKQPFEETPAYIRKDALLKWANKQLEQYVKLQYAKHQDSVHWGQRNAFQQVIDKLNEM